VLFVADGSLAGGETDSLFQRGLGFLQTKKAEMIGSSRLSLQRQLLVNGTNDSGGDSDGLESSFSSCPCSDDPQNAWDVSEQTSDSCSGQMPEVCDF